MPAAGDLSAAARLRALGLVVPAAPHPLGDYVTAVVHLETLVVTGILP